MKKAMKIISIVAIVAILAIMLVACIPSDYNKAISNLKAEGYVGIAYKKGDIGFATATGFLGVEDLEAYIYMTNGDDSITMAYFANTKAAKAAYNDLKETFAADKDRKDFEVKQRGKVVYLGTDKAVKDVQ